MNIRDALHILEIAAANYVNIDKMDGGSLIEQLVDRVHTEKILEHYNYMLASDQNYTLLDALCAVLKNAAITKHKQEIALDYITSNKWDLLTRLLSRDVYKNVVRDILKRENKFGLVTLRYINTDSRFDIIYYQFVKTFAKDSVGSFSDGHFGGYIAHAFQQYFLKEHKKDIWYTLREIDIARKETDMKQSLTNVELMVTDSSDFYINDLLKNIYQANVALFKHNGHTLNTIVYDIFHLCVNHRINSYLASINNKLQTFHIELIDTGRPQLTIDEKTGKVIEERIKGASSKIGNGLKMIPILYDYVKEKKLNMNAIGDLREYAFTLGKDAVSDSNCIWKLEPVARATEKRIDNSEGIRNYKNFEIILKGIISVYSMINGLESRGISPVSIYDEDLFKNIEVIRYMDYLSSIKYKDLMLELQNSNKSENTCKVLDNFQDAVHNRAGSSENNRSDNQERRAKALLNGLLVEPPLKKKKIYSDYDNLYHVYLQLSALPRTLDLFKFIQIETGSLSQSDIDMVLNLNNVPPKYIGSSYMRSNRYNKVLQSKPYLTDEYITAYQPINLQYTIPFLSPTEEKQLHLIYNNEIIPLDKETNSFIVRESIFNKDDVIQLYNTSDECDFQLVEKPILEEVVIPMFDLRLQLSNSNSAEHIRELNKAIKYKYSKDACMKFNLHYIELSKIQEDFIFFMNILKDFYSIACQYPEFSNLCKEFVNELRNKEFKEEVLEQFILNSISNYFKIDLSILTFDALQQIFSENENLNVFIKLLLVSLFNKDLNSIDVELDTILNISDANDTALYKEFIHSITWNDINSSSKVFVLFFNYINSKLKFFTAIRDIYDILFLVVSEIKTLTTELSTRYGLEAILPNMVSDIPDGIALDTLEDIVVIEFIKEIYKSSMDTHNFIIKLFTRYIHGCTHAFEHILDYNAIGRVIAKDEFRHWGDVFNLTKKETNIPLLDKLRELYSLDDSGFFMRNSEYFKGISKDGHTKYFIHYTGKLLVQNSDGTYSSVHSLNLEKELSDEERKMELNEIINRGLAYA